mgnify:CR=1 FL=1
MDYMRLLQRADYYEISGNRMTSYCTTLGGGSIKYWDGRKASFDPREPICDLTAFVQVLDKATRINLVQQMYHYWRPDKIISKFHTHGRTYIEEEKTIEDDTFISVMTVHGETEVDLIFSIRGAVKGEKSCVRQRDNVLLIQDVHPVAVEQENSSMSESCIYKVLGFNRQARLSVNGVCYELEVPVSVDAEMSGSDSRHEHLTLVIAAGDTEEQALTKFRTAVANPLNMFAARRASWNDYFANHVPAFDCSDHSLTKMYYFINYMVAGNLYHFDQPALKHVFESTGKFRLLAQWFWDSAFGAMVEKWINDMPVPKSSMLNTLEAQREDGMLPFSLCIDDYTYERREIIQPFILPLAVWDYYLKSGDRQFLLKAIPVLAKFDTWMSTHRDPKMENLVHLEVPGESGWDNSKRYVLSDHLVQPESPMLKQQRWIQSPDFNTYVFLGRKLVARMARETDDSELAQDFTAKADATAKAIQEMWNDDMGLFMDRFEDNHEEIPTRTPGGIIPVLGGFATAAQAEKTEENLLDEDLFWSDYPVCTLARSDPQYTVRDEYFSYWNGRVWPPINWLVIEAMCQAGCYNTAAELIKRSLRMCNASGEAWCMENYHPDTGYPFFSHNIFNYIWGGLFNDMLLRRCAGIQCNAPAGEIIINPLWNEDLAHLSVKGIRMAGHTLDVRLQRRRDALLLTFSHSGTAEVTLVTSKGRRSVGNETVEFEVTAFDALHWTDF